MTDLAQKAFDIGREIFASGKDWGTRKLLSGKFNVWWMAEGQRKEMQLPYDALAIIRHIISLSQANPAQSPAPAEADSRNDYKKWAKGE